MSVRVLIADDHPLFRRGVREVLEAVEGCVCTEAADGLEALAHIRQHSPEVALLDLSMPRADGFDVLAEAGRRPGAPRFVILTLHDDARLMERAFDLGASAYLLKEDAADELLKCLAEVRAGRRYLSRALASDPASGDAPAAPGLLTPAEWRIVKLVGEYKTSREIAAQLNISVRTVDNHRGHIAKKLGLRGRHALLHFAARQFGGPPERG
ncbi:MAG TPA: response regulator transcription factor [Gammaproteobacteria bacterium]|nr:response regulator transcription factor [Gammaproteobacteria bacterium]